ncbi:MAG: hypothetical protein E7092_09215 [Bacteroidales bacterium]|nr:hypothetical protein [Bacteroidales bacterium]
MIMKRDIFIQFAAIASLIMAVSCGAPSLPESPVESKKQPLIYPDYKGVTIPCNIAPLTFEIKEKGATSFVTRFSTPGDKKELLLSGRDVIPSIEEWRDLTADVHKAIKIKVEVFYEKEKKWHADRPFYITVSPDSIDRYLSYRLIPPSYVAYERLEIMQRDLTSFDEEVIFSNMLLATEQQGQCINCHAYKNFKTDNMQFHARQHMGGTLFVHNGEMRKIDLKTDSTVSAGVYPAFNPKYDVVAYSVNHTGQVFHTAHPDKVEVQDVESDIILYNPLNNKVSHISNGKNDLEVFPWWSADGRTLYYCSAHFEPIDTSKTYSQNEIAHYDKIKYDILSRSWNPETFEFGEPDTILACSRMGKSATLPRVSPDGKYLLFALGEYGCFHVWHSDADICMMNLETREWSVLRNSNSAQSESYPSWSSNGKWIMFSSRRDDTNYTRVYMAHVEPGGRASKAFILPQNSPAFYPLFDKSFNRPEFTIEPVNFTPYEAADVLAGEAIKATYSDNCKK